MKNHITNHLMICCCTSCKEVEMEKLVQGFIKDKKKYRVPLHNKIVLDTFTEKIQYTFIINKSSSQDYIIRSLVTGAPLHKYWTCGACDLSPEIQDFLDKHVQRFKDIDTKGGM